MKGIAGFYYVHVPQQGIYECKAKGIFRKENKKPLVGDDVLLEVLDEENKKGNVVTLLPRQNELIRPAVANVDQALVMFSIAKPSPNFNLLDRFLIMMEQQGLECSICFNKADIVSEAEIEEVRHSYENCGCSLYFISAAKQHGIDEVLEKLEGKTTTLAGPSGVGKSTFINLLQKNIQMETGAVSTKIDRGKHTTRHSELILVHGSTYMIDTPGFSSLGLFHMEKEELQEYYAEFVEHEGACKFQGCSHIYEHVCGVKDALEGGQISKVRYDNYKNLYEELQEKRKY